MLQFYVTISKFRNKSMKKNLSLEQNHSFKAKKISNRRSTLNQPLQTISHSQSAQENYIQKNEWLQQEISYSAMDKETIQKQWQKLKSILIEFDNRLKYMINKKKSQEKQKSHKYTILQQNVIKLMEIQNNKKIISINERQYCQLKRRKKKVYSQNYSLNVINKIGQLNQVIKQTKIGNRNMNKVCSKQMSNKIIETNNILKQIRMLQNELLQYKLRKIKLTNKFDQNIAKQREKQNQFESINKDYVKLCKTIFKIQNQHILSLKDKQYLEKEKVYYNKKKMLEIYQKRIKTQKLLKQRKYLNILNEYQRTTQSKNQFSKEIIDMIQRIEESKNMIQKLKQIRNENNKRIKKVNNINIDISEQISVIDKEYDELNSLNQFSFQFQENSAQKDNAMTINY